jgi:outer membrane biosynthesis protein TonB
MIERFKYIKEKIHPHLGMILSVLMHLGIFLMLLISFPQCTRKRSPEIIISVDFLPIKKVTNIENKQVSEPKPKEEEKKPIEKVKPTSVPKETIEEKKPDPKPKTDPVKIGKKKKIVEKSKPKKKEENKKKKPIKPKNSEYDALLKDLMHESKKNEAKDKLVKTPSKGAYNPDLALSMSLKDSIKRQIEQQWSPPAGNKDAGKLQVLLNISFNRDASVSNVRVVDISKYNNDETYKVAADAAMRAVYKASPLQELPAERYTAWQNLEFYFDPSEMIY